MNISGKSIQVPTAGVATVIVLLAAAVSTLVGIGIGTVMAQPSDTPTTVLIVQSPEEPAKPVDPFMNPRSNWMEEGFAGEQYDRMNSGQMVLPAPDPLSVRLLQSDGGFVHCKPLRSVVRKSAPADGVVAINNTLLDLRTNWDGDLTLSPRDSSIRAGRIAIVVNNAHAAWLPAVAVGSSVTLEAYYWLGDAPMWWHLEVCTTNNG